MQPTLDCLPIGAEARITIVNGEDALSSRLMEMGLIDGTPVKVLGAAPLGDPREYLVRGFRISLRSSEARRICVQPL
jgi:ferrous iron transport protein A